MDARDWRLPWSYIKENIMKKIVVFLLPVLGLAMTAFAIAGYQQKTDPWNPEQLLAPADLARTLTAPHEKKPLVLSVGPAAVIKNSVDIGAAHEGGNLDKLRTYLKDTAKDESIVIYCGCCPLDKCPNARPAFSLLNKMGFKNHKLLNLSHNVKADWIDRGYPVNE